MDDIFVYINNSILRSDPQAERIKDFTRVNVTQLLRTKKYNFSQDEMEIIRRCKNERNRDIAKILMAGSGVMGLGLALSANKKQIIQYAAILMSVMVYGHMTEGYGSCLFCLAQVPHSELASQIRLRVFESQPKSRTAEFLNIMGYDKNHLVSPIPSAVNSLHESPKKELPLEVVLKDPQLTQMLADSSKYFMGTTPQVYQVDTIHIIDYVNPNGDCVGHSYHSHGTSQDAVTMLRRVNDTFHYSDPATSATLSLLHGSIVGANNELVRGLLVVKEDGSVSKKGGKQEAVPPVQYEYIHTSTQVVSTSPSESKQGSVNEPVPQKEETGYHGTNIPPHGEETGYHGTNIAPHKEEADYHGTSIPHGEETHYHGTNIPPHGEETHYHATNIPPHGEETDYHATNISPHKEETDYHTSYIPPPSNEYQPFDYHAYFGNSQPSSFEEPNQPPTDPYVSFKKQRHDELHKRLEKRVTWEEIRRRG